MRWMICPRCNLNYIQEGEKMCPVCRKEVRGEVESEEILEMCSECGERPVVPGGELCAYCLKELEHGGNAETEENAMPVNDTNVGNMDSVSSMEEMDLPEEGFDDEGSPFDDEDSDEDEEEI